MAVGVEAGGKIDRVLLRVWNLREFDEVSETVEFFEKLSELLDATEKIKRFRNGRRPRRFSPRKMMCGKAAAEIFVR